MTQEERQSQRAHKLIHEIAKRCRRDAVYAQGTAEDLVSRFSQGEFDLAYKNTFVDENEEIVERLNKRIAVLEDALKSLPGSQEEVSLLKRIRDGY